MVLAVGAIVAGFVGVPAVLGGGNAIEQFLEPSFTAQHETSVVPASPPPLAGRQPSVGGKAHTTPLSEGEHETGPHASPGVELGLMGLSLLIAIAGILLAHRFYVTSPEISDQLAERWAGAHQTLLNKYYVDELYDATIVSGTFVSGRGLWAFDRRVVDGAVNGTGWLTIIGSWFSGLADTHLVDGVVNLIGRTCEEASFWFRRLQTGLVQNYALLMLFGIFAFVSIYLFVR
jgi:NADH-quinone oxidoreductase subunit L